MKKLLALVLALVMIVCCFAACGTTKTDDNKDTKADETTVDSGEKAPGKIGFVTFGLGGEFFQSLADTYKQLFEEAGWEASYADGAFDPATQVAACENYIAQGVDVLVIWAVAADAVQSVIDDAMSRGIKVIAFVGELENYDALMISDNAELADNLNKLAAQWIDAAYADAEDGSVPVAVFTCRAAETGVIQADELLKIAEYSKKVGDVKEVELADETETTGLEAVENLYATNPEIKVYLTAHSGLGLGINNFYTASNSPVKDYTGYGVFAINGDINTAELINTANDGASPFRGMVLTGSVLDTATELYDVAIGIYNGTLPTGHLQKAGTIFVTEATAAEYIADGHTSLTAADFE